jgi:hypothetical protein
MVFVGNKLYGVAQADRFGTDVLVRINKFTGRAKVIGELGVNNVFGLAAGGSGQIYGFAQTGTVIEINPQTGLALQISSASLPALIYGATNSCR